MHLRPVFHTYNQIILTLSLAIFLESLSTVRKLIYKNKEATVVILGVRPWEGSHRAQLAHQLSALLAAHIAPESWRARCSCCHNQFFPQFLTFYYVQTPWSHFHKCLRDDSKWFVLLFHHNKSCIIKDPWTIFHELQIKQTNISLWESWAYVSGTTRVSQIRGWNMLLGFNYNTLPRFQT